MMIKKILFALLAINLFVQSEVGCDVVVENKPVGCSISNVLNSPEPLSLIEKTIVQSNTTSITETLDFVEVYHENKKLKIERMNVDEENACPPNCIEPMNIEDVKTVGELETLAFIEKLKEKKARLLIDVRESKAYKVSTIPSAINLPFGMLQNDSLYQTEVLKLLGGKLLSRKPIKKWSFINAQSLLIFGNSASSDDASSVVKKLLELGYPSNKLLYYRAGILSWEALGLTLYSSK